VDVVSENSGITSTGWRGGGCGCTRSNREPREHARRGKSTYPSARQSARHFQCVDCNVLSQRCFAGQTLHHIRCHARGFFGGCGSALRSVVVVSVSHGWGWRLARWCLQWVSWVRLTEHVNACAQCGDGGNPRQSILRFIVLYFHCRRSKSEELLEMARAAGLYAAYAQAEWHTKYLIWLAGIGVCL
jgi:hypothetical protein